MIACTKKRIFLYAANTQTRAKLILKLKIRRLRHLYISSIDELDLDHAYDHIKIKHIYGTGFTPLSFADFAITHVVLKDEISITFTYSYPYISNSKAETYFKSIKESLEQLGCNTRLKS